MQEKQVDFMGKKNRKWCERAKILIVMGNFIDPDF